MKSKLNLRFLAIILIVTGGLAISYYANNLFVS